MTDHIEDVVADLRVRLTQKLWSLRAGVGEPIENFLAYSAVTAERVCYSFFRRQFPERTRLRNRIRYAVTHHPETTLEEDAVGFWRCRSNAIRTAPRSGSTQTLIDAPRQFALDHRIDLEAPLPALTAAIVAACDQPVEFDRLVDAIAAMLGVTDAPSASRVDPLDRMQDPAATINALLEQRASLSEAWRQVVTLPLRQRTALLLNLRDPDDADAMPPLPAPPIVTMADLAAALEIPESELTELWRDLPLDDFAIAKRLGATRQQVINLRKSARARLARRLKRDQR